MNNSTLADDAELLFSVDANSTYAFRIYLRVQNSTALSGNGLKHKVTVPANATCAFWDWYGFAATFGANAYTQASTISLSTGSTSMLLILEGSVITGATSGTVHLQMAQTTAENTPYFVKVFQGSYVTAWKH